MRTVDRFAGIPLCWLAAIWRSLHRSQHEIHADKIRTILIIKFFGMGSIILTTPMLTRLFERFPQAHVFYLSFAPNAELLRRLPFALTPLAIRTDSIGHFVKDTFLALKSIRQANVDIVFDLEFFSKFSTLVSSLSGARHNIGYALPTFWRERNLTHAVPLDRTGHVTAVFLHQLAIVGVLPAQVPPLARLNCLETETLSMQRKLGLSTNGVETYVVNINAGATAPERRWPHGRFIEVTRYLHRQDPSARIFFIGATEDYEYVADALAIAPDLRGAVANCAGLLSIGELIALLRRSRFLLTNDSGPMHLASAAGTRVIALFGPESPQFYGPRDEAQVLYKQIACSPCLNMYNAKLFVCPYNARCMREITVDDVIGTLPPLKHQRRPRHAITTQSLH